MATKIKPDKKQHIQVFTRVRPPNSQESKSQIVVECSSLKEVTVKDKTQKKTFTFDRVFGPDSKQVDVYKAVVSPLISEVLQGYNCTVFAYGQTGTGKTFTMVGEKSNCSDGSWENDPSCGIIPRTLSHLFDELKVRADEFTVRVSFLELYNEELCDLLAPNDNDDGKNLKLFEDSMKKGSVIVSGLEERTVHNKDDVYAILEAGTLRRQTAKTLMNAQSSRSHTIFTITVHIKVTTPEGEDLIKTGKMNLVDLAGSENIGRSGAVEMRAREAGNINQSLLTLGRVITSLVERTPHVPYRESKLTRILQDSLGGRTKTSIIATVSPALCNIEETLSTFDYAHRARNITNKPEINQKTSKRVLLKEYTEEIERLRRDLIATREKHGVYLASENYNAIMAERENLNKELVSKLQLLKVREEELTKQEEILNSLNMNLYTTQNELAETCQKLQEINKLCTEKEDMLHELGKQTNILLKTTDEAVSDAKTLQDRLDNSRRIMEHNLTSVEIFKNKLFSNFNGMKTRAKRFYDEGIGEVKSHMHADKTFASLIINNQVELKDMTSKIIKNVIDHIQVTQELLTQQTSSNQMFLNEQLMILKSAIDVQNQKAHQIIFNLAQHFENMKSKCSNLCDSFEINKDVFEQQKINMNTVRNSLSKLTELVLALPKIYNEKLKQREATIRAYAENLEVLERKQMTIKMQIEDFGQQLFKMAQQHVELIRKEEECEQAIRSVNTNRRSQEETFLTDVWEALEKGVTKIAEQADDVTGLHSKMEESVHKMKASFESVLLQANNLNGDGHFYGEIQNIVEENSEEVEQNFLKLKCMYEEETGAMTNRSRDIDQKSDEICKSLNVKTIEVEKHINNQRLLVENLVDKNVSLKQFLVTHITEHSEELFLNIHDRIKEIETFFEGIQKYERTGSTPQRKDFNYPKRVVTVSYSQDHKEKFRSEECKVINYGSTDFENAVSKISATDFPTVATD